MKTWSIASVACLLLANSQFISYADAVEGEDPPGFRSPQCTQGLTKRQDTLLKHFNGVFGSFTVDLEGNNNLVNPSMYGPIAALDIKADGYGFNMNSHDIKCNSQDHLLRVGLMAKQADVKGDIHGSVVAQSGNIEATGQSETCLKQSSFSGADMIEDMSDSLFAFAPSTLRMTSEKLSQFTPDTLVDRRSFALTSSDSSRSFKGYRIVKFPACSDSDCVSAIPRKETSISVLKAGSASQSQYQEVPSDEMIVFNIPVYVGKTFTITTDNVNRNISPCQIIYNFFPADKRGNYVSDPNATFTLVRSPGVTIAGTILAPQANIIDAETGYFGGQLLTLQSYQGKGADIKDFLAVSSGQCSSRSLCLPAEHIPQVVTEVVTATAISTKTVGPNENKPAVHIATVTVKEAKIVTAVERVPVVTVQSVKTVTAQQEENQFAAANKNVKVVTAVETVQADGVKVVTAYAEEQPAVVVRDVKVVTAVETVQAEQVTATVHAVKTVTAYNNEESSQPIAKNNRVLAKRNFVEEESKDLDGVKPITPVEVVEAGIKTVTVVEEDPIATVQGVKTVFAVETVRAPAVKVVTAVETVQADGVKVVTEYAEDQRKKVKVVTAVETVQVAAVETVTAIEDEKPAPDGVKIVTAVKTVHANPVTATVHAVKTITAVPDKPARAALFGAARFIRRFYKRDVVEEEQDHPVASNDKVKVVTATKTVPAVVATVNAVKTVTAFDENRVAATVQDVKTVVAVETVQVEQATATVHAVKTVYVDNAPAVVTVKGIKTVYAALEKEQKNPQAVVKTVKTVTAAVTVKEEVATATATATVTAIKTVVADAEQD